MNITQWHRIYFTALRKGVMQAYWQPELRKWMALSVLCFCWYCSEVHPTLKEGWMSQLDESTSIWNILAIDLFSLHKIHFPGNLVFPLLGPIRVAEGRHRNNNWLKMHVYHCGKHWLEWEESPALNRAQKLAQENNYIHANDWACLFLTSDPELLHYQRISAEATVASFSWKGCQIVWNFMCEHSVKCR